MISAAYSKTAHIVYLQLHMVGTENIADFKAKNM